MAAAPKHPATQTPGSEKAPAVLRRGEIIKCDLLLASGKGYPNYDYILTETVDI